MENAALKPLLSLLAAGALACFLAPAAEAAPEPAAAPAATAGAASAAPAAKARRPPSPARLAQQERMRGCNATARERSLSGADRKAFMQGCLRKS